MESAPQVSYEADASSEPQVTYEILNSPELRAEYITLTDGLISRLAEQGTDIAIFLDKSARPVAWLVNELWETLAPKDQNGQILPKPAIKFLNIDREQWGPYVGRSEDKTGRIDIGRIPEEDIEDLRRVMAPVAGYNRPEDESLLTGKNVMVIDEVRMSGDTLHMSEAILQRAFPDAAEIDGAYWMLKPVKRDLHSGAVVGGEVPVWYSDRQVTGRLVANRDSTKSLRSNSSRQRAGKYWLSTNFRDPDLSGRQLKKEAKQLAQDLKQHKIIFMPSPMWSRELEPVSERIARIDGIPIDEYVQLRQETASKPEFINLYQAVIRAREEKKSL
jgi:hypothetical protein